MLDENLILSQERELANYSDDFDMLRRKIQRYKSNLNEAWKAREIDNINCAIDEIERRMRRLSVEIDDIRHDVIKIYQQKMEEITENPIT